MPATFLSKYTENHNVFYRHSAMHLENATWQLIKLEHTMGGSTGVNYNLLQNRKMKH